MSQSNYVRSLSNFDPVASAKRIAHEISPILYAGKLADWVGGDLDAMRKRVQPLADTADVIGRGLVAEVRGARHSRDALHAMDAAVIHLKSMVQAGNDIARLKREALTLELLVKHRNTQKAATALPLMKNAIIAAESSWQRERTMWNSYRRIADEFKGASASAFGKQALALEDVVSKSTIGRAVLEKGSRVLPHAWHHVDHGLKFVGAAVALVKGTREASAKTVLGRAATGAAAGAASLMTNANAMIGVSDIAIGKAFGEQNTIEHFYQSIANNVTALTESAFTGDSRPLTSAHGKAIKGEQGRVLQGWALIGEGVADLLDPAITHLAEVCHGVPTDLRASKTWWDAAAQTVDNTSSLFGETIGIAKSIIKGNT